VELGQCILSPQQLTELPAHVELCGIGVAPVQVRGVVLGRWAGVMSVAPEW
jgi:hypothetical protein